MSRSRAFRRTQLAQAKRRARHLYVRIWRVKPNGTPGQWGYRPAEPSARWVAHMAETHCKPCSCTGCGNARRHFNELTLAERKADLDSTVEFMEEESERLPHCLFFFDR
jgi:hypothetical protein